MYQSNHVLLVAWTHSILSCRCRWRACCDMAIGEAGATNAALFALRLLSVEDAAIATALADFAEEQGKIAEESTNELI